MADPRTLPPELLEAKGAQSLAGGGVIQQSPPGQIGPDLPRSPTQQAAPASVSGNLAASIGNIIQTGSANPAPAPAPAAAGGAVKATLINPQTGEKVVVDSGSQQAQQYFGQGFQLYSGDQAAQPGAAGAGAGAGSVPGLPKEQTQKNPQDVGYLREQAAKTRSEIFSGVYGYTPDEWQDLPPSTQRQLRNQRIQGLVNQLGNINDAIQVAKEEEQNARQTSLDQLNTYLQYGVLDQLDEATLSNLSASTGLDAKALKVISEQKDPPELRSVDGNLYAVQWNPDTGAYETTLVVRGGGASGGGGGGGGGSSSGGGGGGTGDVSFDVSEDTGSAPKPVKVYDAETGAYLRTELVPGVKGDSVLVDQETGAYKEKGGGQIKPFDLSSESFGPPVIPSSSDKLFLQYAEQVGVKKLTQTERDKFFKLKAGESVDEDSGGNSSIIQSYIQSLPE